MADDTSSGNLDTVRKWVRDGAIIVGVLVLVIYPPILGRFIRQAQVEFSYDQEHQVWTVKEHETNLDLAGKLTELTSRAQAIEQTIHQLAGARPGGDLNALSEAAQQLSASADTASAQAAASIASLQDAAGAPKEVAQAGADGWMFLGKVNGKPADAWVGRHAIRADTPPKGPGNYTALGSTFLHQGGKAPPTDNKGYYVRLPVLGAVHNGETVSVRDLNVIEAVDGGYSLWALVGRQR